MARIISPSLQEVHIQYLDETIKDRSLIHHMTCNLFDRVTLHCIPKTVAPNIVTLTGFFALCQAWYMANRYGGDYPIMCTWFAVLKILIFIIDLVDSFHTDRI